MTSTSSSNWDGSLSIESLSAAYHQGLATQTVIAAVLDRIKDYANVQSSVWIWQRERRDVLSDAQSLPSRFPDKTNWPPLYGIPFSIKDNIDVEGIPTTTACPALTRIPQTSAPVFTKLWEQGAIFIGKTNLEQLATGMTGCRSPYGTLHSVYHKDYIVGGSSSGSCVSVAANLVSFSIGSDTAGSGRLPAAFNGIVGWKPTKGTVSCSGITPAQQSQDCVAVLAKAVRDAEVVWRVIKGFDPNDIYSKPEPYALALRPEKQDRSLNTKPTKIKRFGVPPATNLGVCSPAYHSCFEVVTRRMQEQLGFERCNFNWSPFAKAGELLYGNALLAERLASLPDGWLERNAAQLHPATRFVFETAARAKTTAKEVHKALHAQHRSVLLNQIALLIPFHDRYIREVEMIFREDIDVLLVPTAPQHYTIAEVESEPILKNSNLGPFAHFVNVCDLCAVAVPAGTYPVEINGVNVQLPFGVTIIGARHMDDHVLEIAAQFQHT